MEVPRQLGEGWSASEIAIGRSARRTFRLERARAIVWLKRARTSRGRSQLDREHARLQWLAGRCGAPRVVDASSSEGWLATTHVAGVMACDRGLRGRERDVAAAVGRALRAWWAELPVDDCPFDETLHVRLARAEQAVDAGEVDESDFDEERRGRTARDVLEAARAACREVASDLVVAHGDASLPNVLLDPVTLVPAGFVDLGGVGVADVHQDLAIAARSVEADLGAEHVGAFLDATGVLRVDLGRLAAYRLLDELS